MLVSCIVMFCLRCVLIFYSMRCTGRITTSRGVLRRKYLLKRHHTAIVNDSFLVGFAFGTADSKDDGICVYCFDENIQLAGGRSTGAWNGDACKAENVWD